MKLTKTHFGLVSAFALALMLPACGSSTPTSPSTGELIKEDVTIGTGALAASGDTVTVSYVGTLTNGTQFDAGTFSFRLGANQVIAGFDQGVTGMRVGGRRRLTIPPNLGYGSQANGPIPGNSTLKFDITLISIAGK
jgi:FKBP-type peptidyl-prolyl cis-trans isomerase